MEGKLLVIIDPQNDFTSDLGFYAKRHPITAIKNTISKINKLTEKLDPSDILIIQSNYKPSQFEPGIDMCIPNTYGCQINQDLKINPSIKHIIKTDHSVFSSTEFKTDIKEKAIHTLTLTGFLAEYCVKQTAIDAIQNQLNIELVEDCISTGDDVQKRKKDTLEELKAKGATIMNSNDIIENYNN